MEAEHYRTHSFIWPYFQLVQELQEAGPGPEDGDSPKDLGKAKEANKEAKRAAAGIAPITAVIAAVKELSCRIAQRRFVRRSQEDLVSTASKMFIT